MIFGTKFKTGWLSALALPVLVAGCNFGDVALPFSTSLALSANPAKSVSPTPAPTDPNAGAVVLPLSKAIFPQLLLPERSFFTPVHSATSTKKVFAHYMLCNAAFWTSGVPGAMEDILLAQQVGIDGFALNEGAWLAGPSYRQNTAALFAAAEQLGTGFQLFFSADMTGVGAADIIDMMGTYATHPNYLHQDGKPVLSTYGGNTYSDGSYPNPVDWWPNRVLAPLSAKGIDVYFVPDFAQDYFV